MFYPFLVYPAPGLLERHSGHRTSHASLIAEILNLLAGGSPPPPLGEPDPPRESLSDSEKRILRYPPTHLSAPEIAGELHLSVHTIKPHMRHLYAKFATHPPAETIERARAPGPARTVVTSALRSAFSNLEPDAERYTMRAQCKGSCSTSCGAPSTSSVQAACSVRAHEAETRPVRIPRYASESLSA
jgi:DNA-binding CsgD family transcriptional regulator